MATTSVILAAARLMLAALWCAMAIVVFAVTEPTQLSRTRKKQEEDSAEPVVATLPLVAVPTPA